MPSARLFLALVLAVLCHVTIARDTRSTNEDGDSVSANERPSVSTNRTSDPIIEMLDRQRAAAEERTEILEDNIRSLSENLEEDEEERFFEEGKDEEEEDEDEDEVEPERKKKKRRKGKGRKKNKGKGRKKNRKSKSKNYMDLVAMDTDMMAMEELPVNDATYDSYGANRYRSDRYTSSSVGAPRMADMEAYFNVKGLDDYLEQCDDCYEPMDRNENLCPMHQSAMEMKKWADQLENVLSHGCSKAGCDSTCCLARQGPFEPLVVRMTQMMKDVFMMIQRNCKDCNPKQDCPWTEWSPCSRSCGTGQQTRTRACPGRYQLASGQESEEKRDCKISDCPTCEDREWSSWSRWSMCSETCGQGVKDRRRTCQLVSAGVKCGQTCADYPDSEQDVEEEMCEIQQCPICQWSSWNRWSQCSETCGQGFRSRERVCQGGRSCAGQCPGPYEQSESCVELPETDVRCRCEQRNWGPWSEVGECSVTCGEGIQERERSCQVVTEGKDCGRSSGQCDKFDRDYDNKPCYRQACVECDWTSWNRWSDCSQTCGQGVRERERQCEGTGYCIGQCMGRPQQQETCQELPMNDMRCRCQEAEWSTWSRWSQCSKTCGQGDQLRTRTCRETVSGSECGRNSCGRIGQVDEDTRDCQLEACKCERRAWTEWEEGPCSVTCGSGTFTKSRECQVVELGDQCPHLRQCEERDVDSVELTCQKEACCAWENWQRWSSCSQSCGQGFRTRRRECGGGRFCAGSGQCGRDDEQREECEELPLTSVQCRCEEREWSSWTDGICSVTCGEGVERGRQRTCEVVRDGTDCGRRSGQCARGQTDRDNFFPCRRPDCLVCEWSSWNRWSQCSQTCGQGSKTRERRCQGNGNCDGQCGSYRGGLETVDCQMLPMDDRRCRCEEKEWSEWEPWTQCSKSCGQGVRERYRRCQVKVDGQDCGASCYGDVSQKDTCEDRSMDHHECQNYEYGDWNEWCPCDCTTGQRSRRRECFKHNPYGSKEPVDINNCIGFGQGRQTETCDVAKFCPGCKVNCVGLNDGVYQSCSSCREYINCTNNVPSLRNCAHRDTEWDDFVKMCVQGPSPSCSLKTKYEDCTNLPDGKYPSTRDCSQYLQCTDGNTRYRNCNRAGRARQGYTMEYNHFTQSCVSVRLPPGYVEGSLVAINSPPGSPTCMRNIIYENRARLNTTIFENRATLGSLDLLVSDAPADMYYDEEHGLSREERRLKYEREVNDKKAREAKDARRAERLKVKVNKVELLPNDVLELENSDCVQDCDGTPAGLYASCRGCRYYVICTKHGQFRERKCPKGKEFDTSAEKCVRESTTCQLRRR